MNYKLLLYEVVALALISVWNRLNDGNLLVVLVLMVCANIPVFVYYKFVRSKK